MKISMIGMGLAALLAIGPARADRVAGIAGLPPARAASAAVAPAPALVAGNVTALRPDGTQVQIDGKWYRLKPGRSVLLRKGLPVGADALRVGQTLKFSLASNASGETALGVVHVP